MWLTYSSCSIKIKTETFLGLKHLHEPVDVDEEEVGITINEKNDPT